MGGPAVGPEAAKHMMEGAYKIRPDLHVSVEDIIAEGDKVTVRNIWTGTMASDTKIELHGFVLWKIKDGKIVERWATITSPADEKNSSLTWLK
jgi:predicted ester cyclase